MNFTAPAAVAAFFFGVVIGAAITIQFVGALCVEVVR